MMKLANIFLPLVLVCPALILVACDKTESTEVQTEDYKDNSHLPVINVATYGSMAPFAFLDAQGNLTGIDVDTIRAIGEIEGFEVHFNSMPWQNLFDSVESGDNDLAIAGISYSDERANKYGLSKSYMFVPAAIMYKDQSLKINGLQDLKGLNVGGIENSKQVQQMKEVGGYNKISEPATIFLAFQEMVNGKSDAIFEDKQVLEHLEKMYPEYSFNIVAYEDQSMPSSQQVIMTKKGNTQLLNKLNHGIDQLIASGQMQQIEDKWLHEESLLTINNNTTANTMDKTTSLEN
ncbi:substrate-binding periplasmic protein [Psychrobacter sp. I-STPA6b]|uniref:substrate-binding periplasmic protein n=1 Tax=Psychrobacter sp. I-STPA6b TaxID=2585718 RepID=UPI001D0CC1B5|nr:transporter substrate-binding domain-containing protein [Psychrobacter sp. I-STPA6b]